jgi:hypothetical protein
LGGDNILWFNPVPFPSNINLKIWQTSLAWLLPVRLRADAVVAAEDGVRRGDVVVALGGDALESERLLIEVSVPLCHRLR